MKKNVFILLTMLFFAVSCSEETLVDSFELNKLQTFIPGVTYQLQNREASFRIIEVNDSRCPKGAECVWEGMVQTDLVFQLQTTDTLRLNTYDNPSDTVENYVFQLMDADPYPELDKEIKFKDYRILLNIFELSQN